MEERHEFAARKKRNKFAGKVIVVVVVKVAEIKEKSCSFSNRGKS